MSMSAISRLGRWRRPVIQLLGGHKLCIVVIDDHIMNFMGCLKGFQLIQASVQIQSVRFRYHAEKLAKGKLIRRYGYEEKLLERGTIPHLDGPRLPMPVYRPKDMWNERRALFGQNDYIDILGCENLHPTRLLYDVPMWLRGFKGNEFQHCLRKKNMLRNGSLRYEHPLKWDHLMKRIRYLHRFLNKYTKTGFTDKASG